MRWSRAARAAQANHRSRVWQLPRASSVMAAAAVLLSMPGGIIDGAAAEAATRPSPAALVAEPATEGDTQSGSAPGAASGPDQPKESTPAAAYCDLIEAQARHYRLPPGFLTRVLWKESLFNPNAVSPKGAQGIAQFMPGTAAERGLADPFDPEEAIPHSARFLRELQLKFGNLGLAAAAYNAGPQRVTSWLSGRSSLPAETLDYVQFITGRAAADWHPAASGEDQAAAGEPDLGMACGVFVVLAARGQIGGAKAAPRAPKGPVVARHGGGGQTIAAAATGQQIAGGPAASGGEPVVTRLAGGGKPSYVVKAGVRSHTEARQACSRLRASGSYCVVVIR